MSAQEGRLLARIEAMQTQIERMQADFNALQVKYEIERRGNVTLHNTINLLHSEALAAQVKARKELRDMTEARNAAIVKALESDTKLLEYYEKENPASSERGAG